MNRMLFALAVALFTAALWYSPKPASAAAGAAAGCDQECADMYSCRSSSEYQICSTSDWFPCAVNPCNGGGGGGGGSQDPGG
jgi:hypothetical protein